MKKSNQIICLALAVLVCFVMFSGCKTDEGWVIYNPDDYSKSDPSIIIPRNDSQYTPIIRLDSQSNPHIVWCEVCTGTIRYIKWNGESWVCADDSPYSPIDATISGDSTLYHGGGSLDPRFHLDSRDRPHILWTDFKFTTAGSIVYMIWDEDNWKCLDGSVCYLSNKDYDNPANIGISRIRYDEMEFVLDENDYPHFVFGQSSIDYRDTFYVRWDGKKLVCADGSDYDNSSFGVTNNACVSKTRHSENPALKLDSMGLPHIAWEEGYFRDRRNCLDIYYVKWDGDHWVCTDGSIYDATNDNCGNPANISKTNDSVNEPILLLDDHDNPTIISSNKYEYWDAKYYRFDGTNWVCYDGSVYAPNVDELNCANLRMHMDSPFEEPNDFTRKYFFTDEQYDQDEMILSFFGFEERENTEDRKQKCSLLLTRAGKKYQADFMMQWSYHDSSISFDFDKHGFPHIVWLVIGLDDNSGVHYIRWDGKNWVCPK